MRTWAVMCLPVQLSLRHAALISCPQIDEMQAKDAEDFNKLKIRLETDIQVLQQQLQHMQATYLLNTEKLDYNFRVLTEK